MFYYSYTVNKGGMTVLYLAGLSGPGFAGTDNFGRTLGICGHRTKTGDFV